MEKSRKVRKKHCQESNGIEFKGDPRNHARKGYHRKGLEHSPCIGKSLLSHLEQGQRDGQSQFRHQRNKKKIKYRKLRVFFLFKTLPMNVEKDNI